MIDLHLSGKPKGLGNALKSGTRQPSARNEAKIRLEAYQKIIDLPTSGGLPTGPLATTLPGALDPVNFHIDLTRQGLNPVVGEAGKSAAKPIVSESLLPRASFPLAGRAGELPVFDSKAGSPFSIAGSLAPLLEPPKPTPSPLRLEMPKRGFQ
jgi:hypothetical protein